VFNDIYIYGHWPVIAAVLIWMLNRQPEQFAHARNAMLVSGAIALIVFAVFPVAPPRLADPAMLDTVTLHTNAYRVLQPTAFTNAYAAMPSLHCGWDLIIGLSVARVARRRWVARAAALLPAAMVAAVIVTGNHYLLDAAAGDLLALAAFRAVSKPTTTIADAKMNAAATLPPRHQVPTPRGRWTSWLSDRGALLRPGTTRMRPARSHCHISPAWTPTDPRPVPAPDDAATSQ
jgi:hypothetical protein